VFGVGVERGLEKLHRSRCLHVYLTRYLIDAVITVSHGLVVIYKTCSNTGVAFCHSCLSKRQSRDHVGDGVTLGGEFRRHVPSF